MQQRRADPEVMSRGANNGEHLSYPFPSPSLPPPPPPPHPPPPTSPRPTVTDTTCPLTATLGITLLTTFCTPSTDKSESLSTFWAPPRCRRKAFRVRNLSTVLRTCSSTSLGSVKGGVGNFLRTEECLSTKESGECKTGISGY